MKRRKFIHNSLLAGVSTVGAVGVSVASPRVVGDRLAAKPFKMKYAPHFGMFDEHAGEDLLDQLSFMADMGFRAVEDNGMMKRTPEMQEKIGKQLDKLGMEMGVFVLDKGGNGANTLAAGKDEYVDIFIKGCKAAVDVAKRVNAKWTTVVPGDFERKIPMGIQTAHVINALRKGAEILEPHGLVMVLEPLSDTPDLFLRHSDQTYMICKAVNSPSCKILFDIYHMQRNEGELITNIDRTWDELAYVQIGENPGRKEPTTGEINYKSIFQHLHEKGYDGVLGMEHGNSRPGKDGEQAVIDAYRLSDVSA
jgi:hydroxypyruvate isomerase